ncbi:MAG: hypothetical protein WD249_10310 [Gaiellaceae bacterium]
MDVAAHGGTLGLLVELGPAVVLAGVGVAVWLRQRRSAPGDEAGIEEPRRDGE